MEPDTSERGDDKQVFHETAYFYVFLSETSISDKDLSWSCFFSGKLVLTLNKLQPNCAHQLTGREFENKNDP